MSSVTDIVDTISYVLVAFVAISLVVSSIMIGVITYISVLERRKEIGILRAIGASKNNISQVFNAETVIIGLCAGLIGIGLSLLILIPGNMVIHAIAGTTDVNAVLPVSYTHLDVYKRQRMPKENTVETVCLLSNRKSDAKVRIDVDLEDYYRIKDEEKNQN